jgi:DNA-binding transcriptional MerR regulator
MLIGAVSRATGATAKAIRLYEARGLILRPTRQGRYRRYSALHVEQIRLLREGQRLGFTLRQLHALLGVGSSCEAIPWDAVRSAIAAKVSEIDAQITRLQAQRAELVAFAGATGDGACPP